MDKIFIVHVAYGGFRAMMTELPGLNIMAESRYPEPSHIIHRCVK